MMAHARVPPRGGANGSCILLIVRFRSSSCSFCRSKKSTEGERLEAVKYCSKVGIHRTTLLKSASVQGLLLRFLLVIWFGSHSGGRSHALFEWRK